MVMSARNFFNRIENSKVKLLDLLCLSFFYQGCRYLTTGPGWNTLVTVGTGASRGGATTFTTGAGTGANTFTTGAGAGATTLTTGGGAGTTTGLTIFTTPGTLGAYTPGTAGPKKVGLAKTALHKKANTNCKAKDRLWN